MRPELELTETIEKYLKGELNDAEKLSFEKRLSDDSRLKQEVKLQQDIMNGIERAKMKQKLQKAYNKYMRGKNFIKWGSLGTVIVLVSLTILFYTLRHRTSEGFIQNLPEFNEQGTKQWGDADKYLPGQTFILNTNQDTVIQTRGGLIIAVPVNCFLDDKGKPVSGPIELEIKEALDPASIMKAGLSTKAGDNLLESAGMFYLNGRKDGKSLKIDPKNGIYVRVPADTIQTGMQAFEGKRMPDGSIGWINPKPLLHDLIPVDIHTLNFYPPLYLDSLAMWGKDIKNKEYTDSLYYSFASIFSEHFKDHWILAYDSGIDLYVANCQSCHTAKQHLILPISGIQSLADRVPQPYDTWLLKYIKNNEEVRKSGDKYANKLGGGMTVFEGTLTDRQINNIITFLTNTNIIDDTTSDLYYIKDTTFSADLSDTVDIAGINPAKIKAIWCDEFQNTLISTKEFEARMPFIYKTCNAAILDLYVNNIDKRLSYIDSLSAELSYGDLKNAFLSFAARGDGKVAVKSSLFEKLKAFFQRKSKLFTEAAAKARKDFMKKQNELDTVAGNKNNEDQNRANQMRGEEYKANLKEACRQVGDPASIGRVDKNGYAILCIGTGWVNIDAYVWKSTLNRTTLNYTSPTNGKTAIIKYLPFNITVNDYQNYDNVFVYLLPDKLNSFMRLSDTNGKFKEKMDELFSYKLECVAYKGNQAFYYSMDAVQPKDYNGISLQEISPADLDKKLGELGNKDQQDDMTKEVEYMQYETEDKKRRKKNEEVADLTNKIRKVIFPCFQDSE